MRHELLTRGLQRLLEKSSEVTYFDYYSGPFDHYEARLLSKDERRDDIRALAELIVPGGTIIEIGAGSGVVAKRLSPMASRIYAVESSATAFEELRRRLGACQNVEPVLADALDWAPSSSEEVDAVVLASLSINLFPPESIDRLLSSVHRLLKSDGSFLFGSFDVHSKTGMERYRGDIDASVFFDLYEDEDGTLRLMHIQAEYCPTSRTLRQTWAVDLHGSTKWPRFAVSAMKERIWTIEDLEPYLRSAGFRIVDRRRFSIVGGGADASDAYVFRVQKD